MSKKEKEAARQASRERAQSFLTQKMKADKKFKAGQDYTGGATAARGKFNPKGRARKKMNYTFKAKG